MPNPTSSKPPPSKPPSQSTPRKKQASPQPTPPAPQPAARQVTARIKAGVSLIALGTIILGLGGALNSVAEEMTAFALALAIGAAFLFTGFLLSTTPKNLAPSLISPPAPLGCRVFKTAVPFTKQRAAGSAVGTAYGGRASASVGRRRDANTPTRAIAQPVAVALLNTGVVSCLLLSPEFAQIPCLFLYN